jgi:hypothetical protein
MSQTQEQKRNNVATIMSTELIERTLTEVEQRRGPVLKIVQQVCKGLKPAAMFYGPPGHGKSHAILGQMDLMADQGWVPHNAGLTPKGLFDAIVENPDKIHVIEDCEDVHKSQDFADILRPACDDGSDRDRVIRWKTAKQDFKQVFTGGIIIISNCDISKVNGPLQAVASRFKPVKWSLSTNELVCVMLKIAEQGYSKRGNSLSPKQCKEIVEWLHDRITSGEALVGVDLRLLTQHCYPAYVQSILDGNPDNWKEVILAILRGESTIPDSRDDRNAQLEKIAMQISMMPIKTNERFAKWKEMTGRGKSQYSVHLQKARLANGGKQ